MMIEQPSTTREWPTRAKPCPRRRQQSRQARSALGLGLLTLGVLQGLLFLQLNFGDWRYQDRTYEVRLSRVRGRLSNDQDQSPSLALFLGSSAVVYGVKGPTFEKEMSAALGRPWLCCNVAALASGPLLEMIYLERVLDEGIRPQLVVAELHPVSVTSNVLDTLGILRRSSERFGNQDLERLEACGMPGIEDCRRHRLRDLLFPFYGHRFALLAAHAERFVPPDRIDSWAQVVGDDTGWVRLPECPKQEHDARWKKMGKMYADNLDTLRIIPAEHNAIRQLLRRCQRDDIAVAILVSPWASEFDTSWWSKKARQQFAEILDGIGRDFSVPIIDARNWMADDYYYDPVHLGAEGADQYTRKLVRECLVPLCRQPPSAPAMFVAHRR